MTINHIDQLTEWWETAEEGDARPGDTIITPGNTHYLIETAPDYPLDRANQPYRILARAPKPKPAWHDAVAVIAHTDDGHIRQVWERDGDTDYWCGTEGYLVRTEKLHDVTPMLEAKVTDEMRKRVGDVLMPRYGTTGPDGTIDAILTAALGLEAA